MKISTFPRTLSSTAIIASLMFLVSPALPVVAGPPDPLTNVSNATGMSSEPAAIADASGAIHVAWADNPGSDDTTRQQVFYARSADGGSTFDSATRISVGVDNDVRPREIRIAVAPSGVVVVAWWAVVDEGADRDFLTAFVARSTNGGATFTPAVATSLRFRDRITAPKEGYSNTTSLAVALGDGGETFLLATVQDYFHGFNVYFARSSDGLAFSDPERVSDYTLTIPRAGSCGLAVLPSDEIVGFWSEALGDFVDEVKTIYRVSSTDGGRSFGNPVRVAKAQGVVGSVLSMDTGLAMLAQTQRGPRSKGVIKFFRSSDDGSSFPARAKVGSSPAYVHAHQNSVAANAAGVVAIAWTENSSKPGPAEGIYVTVSRDGGRTFDTAQLVVAGLFIDPPAVTVGPDGSVGVVYASSVTTLTAQEVLFRRVE
ncbi:MAG: exo-alpha-sialidase [Blastocatellia bacterium]|nr:exo-alpha-sialidase [Blastocatellia bacterium]